MELGTEISINVKKTIKKQLQTLGCYVDDELPEYIMVMIANKRTKAQMVDDLQLFLSDEAEKFVVWLCLVLERIQKAVDVPDIDALMLEEEYPKSKKQHNSDDESKLKTIKKKTKDEKTKRKFKEKDEIDEEKNKQKHQKKDNQNKNGKEFDMRRKESLKSIENKRNQSSSGESRSRSREWRSKIDARRSRSRNTRKRSKDSRSRSRDRRKRSRSRNHRKDSRSRSRDRRKRGRSRNNRKDSRSRSRDRPKRSRSRNTHKISRSSRSRSRDRRKRSRSRNTRKESRSRSRGRERQNRQRNSRSSSRKRAQIGISDSPHRGSRSRDVKGSRLKSPPSCIKNVNNDQSDVVEKEDLAKDNIDTAAGDIREEAEAEAKRIESKRVRNPMDFVKQIACDINKKLLLPSEDEQLLTTTKDIDKTTEDVIDNVETSINITDSQLNQGNISLQAVSQYGELEAEQDKEENKNLAQNVVCDSKIESPSLKCISPLQSESLSQKHGSRSRSKSPLRKHRSRSRSKSPLRKHRSHSRSKSPLRKHRSRSRSKSPLRKHRSHSRSKSPLRKHRSRSRSKSPLRKHRSRSRSKAPLRKRRSCSRSKSPLRKHRSRSRSIRKHRSRSRSIRKRRSRIRSKSPLRRNRSRSRSKSLLQRSYSHSRGRKAEFSGYRRPKSHSREEVQHKTNKQSESIKRSKSREDKSTNRKERENKSKIRRDSSPSKSNIPSQVKVFTDFERKSSLAKHRQASSALLKRAVTDVVNEIPVHGKGDDAEADLTANVESSLHKSADSDNEANLNTSDRRIINFNDDDSNVPTITLVNYKSDSKAPVASEKKLRRQRNDEDNEDLELRKGLLQDMSKVDARYAILKSRLDHETSYYNSNHPSKQYSKPSSGRKKAEFRNEDGRKDRFIGSMVADLEERSNRDRKESLQQSRQRSYMRSKVARKRKPMSSDEERHSGKRSETLKNETKKIRLREAERSEKIIKDSTDLRNLLREKKESKALLSSDDEDEIARKLREKIKEEKHKRLFGKLKSGERNKLKHEREELRDKLKQKKLQKSQSKSHRLSKSAQSPDQQKNKEVDSEEWIENENNLPIFEKSDGFEDENQNIETEKIVTEEDDDNKVEERDENEAREDEQVDELTSNEKDDTELNKTTDDRSTREEEKEEVRDEVQRREENNRDEEEIDEENKSDENDENDEEFDKRRVEKQTQSEQELSTETGEVDCMKTEDESDKHEIEESGAAVKEERKKDSTDRKRKHKHKSSKRRHTRHEFIVTLNGIEQGNKNISIKTHSSRRSDNRERQTDAKFPKVNTRGSCEHSSSFTQSDEEFETILRDKEKKEDSKRQQKIKKHSHRRHSTSKQQQRRLSGSTDQNAEQLSAVDREIMLAEEKLKTQQLLRRSLEQVQNVKTSLSKVKTTAFINPHFQASQIASSFDSNLFSVDSQPLVCNVSLQTPLVEAGNVSTTEQQSVQLSPLPDVSKPKLNVPATDVGMLHKEVLTDDKSETSKANQERCAYWPDCKKPNCGYIHPTVNCKSFPNCCFGDRCLYIHPPCKFAERCVNPDCSFTHLAQTSDFTATAICKFSPNCTNTDCPFIHPINKPCKFGSSCSKKDCIFSHETTLLHAKSSKHKWVANKSHISDRNFAVSEAGVTETPVTITLTSADY